ncbi:hypothetical protein [Methanobacterium sp.]|uniref:hypothetical protein n=1 Tax=Methanobacterium sp. TaxID=2164 RepID=UPI002AB92D0F|nr:hypothetical protein [Methanobacterium sp.]MDY9922788.1 hypothetical protein [Methanobacterium sp.]
MAKNDETTSEESSEVVIKEVEVEKPLDLAEKSPEELENLQSEIESQKIQNHLQDEEARIKAMVCPLCGRKLGLKPDKYMKTGNIPEEIECKKCEKLLTVSVIYNDDPETTDAEITIKPGNYVWETKLPSQWTDKHVTRWAEEEMKKLPENRSSLSINEQKLFRLLYLGLKKQKLVK